MQTQDNEVASLKPRTLKRSSKPVSYIQLYRFATKSDYVLMFVSFLGALGNGLTMPIYSVIFGNLTDSYAYDDDQTKLQKAGLNTLYMVILGIATLAVTFLMYATFSISTENQITRLRKKYLKSLLQKKVQWYDEVNTNSLNTKINSEILAISEAIGEKTCTFAFSIAAFLSGFLIGYIKGWKLALVITSALPILAITIACIGFSASWREQFTIKSDITSSAQVEEVLASIKTVKMMDGEEFEVARFYKIIAHSAKSIVKFGLYYGLSFGAMSGFQQWTYALGAYYSGQVMQNQADADFSGPVYSSGSICTVFFAILMGSFSLGQIGPCLSSFAKGKLAAREVFDAIEENENDEKQRQDCLSIDNFKGDIKIQNISFCYPTKPNIFVLKNITFNIPQGKKIALVGESGSGKSTIGQLLLQFYDIINGNIIISDQDIPINQFNKQEYRQKIAIVQQEPVLFATTIKENIKLGNQNATDEQIIKILELMNSNELIQYLNINVGTNGNQFSGGQKQRIALARALITNPQLLILDEATSALDRFNEKQITKIIDENFKYITRLVIAHRLTTIQDSDIIIVFHQGEIIGQGNHQELLLNCPHYQYLIQKQQIQEEIPQQTTSLADIFRKEINESPMKTLIMDAQQNDKTKVKLIDTQLDLQKLTRNNDLDEDIEISESTLSFRQCLQKIITENITEIYYLIIGCLCALVNGSIYPLFSQVLADVIEALLIHNPLKALEEGNLKMVSYQLNALNDSINNSTRTLFILGFIYFISTTLECLSFSIYSERLTINMRVQMFQKFLRLPIKFYDYPNNNAGYLTPRITSDARIIQQLFQNIIGFKCQYFSAMFVGFLLAFIASWKLTLLAVGVTPIVYFGSKLSQKYVVGSQSSFIDKVYVESNKILMEALTNIRTVYSLRAEKLVFNQYNQLLIEPSKQSKRLGAFIGISSGYAQMKPFVVNAYLFFMGTLLLVYDDLTVLGIYQTILAIIFAVVGGAKEVYFQSDNEKAKRALNYYFNLMQVEDEFQIEQRQKSPQIKQSILGNIEFKNVNFSYPQRPNIQILKNLNLRIDACKTIGLVGNSGCGKSTIFQLLLRFYTIDNGDILIDGQSIYNYDLKYLRQQISIVSQEPQLFNESIKYNIKYNLKNITDQDIKQATILSYAYDFIMQNNDKDTLLGFNKNVGSKGSLISGGQKQRIAIARSLLRNSSVYLFDEATSALDSNVESIVQKQLEDYLISKTSLIIAHRISTIKNCQIIYVFEQGQIIEQGNYDYLVNLKGHFYNLEQGLFKQKELQKDIYQQSIIEEQVSIQQEGEI